MQTLTSTKISAPSHEAQYAAASSEIMNIVAIITGSILVVYLILTIATGSIHWFQTFGVSGLFITSIVAVALRKRQLYKFSSFIFLAGFWFILSLYSAYDGGFEGITFIAMMLCIFFAGLLVNVQGVSLFTFGILITQGVLLYLHFIDRLPEPAVPYTDFQRWFGYGITIIAAAVVSSYTSAKISRALATLQKQEQVLRLQNKNLAAQKEEHKRISEQLANSKSLLEATFEAIADGVLAVDNERNAVAMNQVFKDLWNVPADLPDLHSAHQLFRSQLKFPIEATARIEEIYANPESESYDLMERIDGKVYERFSQPQIIDGDIAGRVWTYRDITYIKGTEEALQASEKRFRKIFELAPIGMAMTGIDGRYIQVNQAMCQILGYSQDELLTLGRRQTTHPDDIHLHKELHDQLIKGKNSGYQLEKRYLRKDKSTVVASVHVTHIKDEQGHSLYNIIQVLDLTEKKRSEEAMRQAQKLESLGIMSGGIAHDFNNLLTAILARSSYAMSILPDQGKAHTHIAQIVSAAHRASDLTHQLLAYSGRAQFEKKSIDLNSLITENLHLVETAVESKAMLSSSLAKSLPPIEGDNGQLQQVVMNLIINAAEAIQGEAGTIVIKTSLHNVTTEGDYHLTYTNEPIDVGQYVVMEIEDSGIGMDEETLSKIFDPFFSTKTVGRGLGLAAVLGIVRGHNGSLRVESTPFEGTVFQLFLPASTKPVDADVEPATPIQCSPISGIVLMVDDQEPILDAVEAILSQEEITMLKATSGLMAVELFRKRKEEISLIILDLSMPGFSGEATLQRLRTIDPNVPIIISSGYSQGESVAQLEKNNIAAFLPKPYSWDQLTTLVREALRPTQADE